MDTMQFSLLWEDFWNHAETTFEIKGISWRGKVKLGDIRYAGASGLSLISAFANISNMIQKEIESGGLYKRQGQWFQLFEEINEFDAYGPDAPREPMELVVDPSRRVERGLGG